MEKISQGLTEKSLEEEYLAALNGTIFQADALQKNGSYQEAGRLYREILLAFPRDAELITRASLAPEQAMAGIDTCAEKLMGQGLVAYRSGDLTHAIEIWQGVLTFHPQYEPARTAMDTAKRQLNNLKTMEEKTGEKNIK